MSIPSTPMTSRRRPTRGREWMALSTVAVTLVLGLQASSLMHRPNRLIQDTLIALQARAVDRSEVIIVSIDEKSIDGLGRWPWRRAYHAALIDRLDRDAPRAIGLNLFLTEDDALLPSDDQFLAGALARSGKVTLPLMMQNVNRKPVLIKPVPTLERGARNLGHVHLSVDEDGVVRSTYLREGLPDRMWDHFNIAMMATGEAESRPLAGLPEVEEALQDPISGQFLAWQRAHRIIVPFAGPPGHFRRVPYVDVLNGSTPAGTFKDKYVLIGATAAGLGDMYATPVAGRRQLMPGVEILANVLDGLLGNHSITPAPAWIDSIFNTLAVLLALIGLAFLGPLPALLLTASLILAMPALAAASTVLLRVQLAPAAGMLALGLTYALWSWRRLDAATRYLVDEFNHLQGGGDGLPVTPGAAGSAGDFLDRRIQALKQAAKQLRDLQRFVSDTLEGLPDATLVCDRTMVVLLSNAAAARHFGVDSGASLRGALASALMRDVLSEADREPVIGADTGSLAPQPSTAASAACDGLGRNLLVKQAPLFSAGNEHLGWIVSLVDVTEMRQAQQQLEYAVRFLSHDIRTPQTSILTLLNLQRQNPSAMSQGQFHDRIERHARKSLAQLDNFIHLIRAQSAGYRLERCDLVTVLIECIDDAWEDSQHNQIAIVMGPHPPQAESLIDRELVARAIGNLLVNALKFSGTQTTIRCGIDGHELGWAILVQDQGPGIAEDIHAELFQPFFRGHASAHVDGAGLGLALVKTVAQRHGGVVLLDSAPGRGSAFRLVLPRA